MKKTNEELLENAIDSYKKSRDDNWQRVMFILDKANQDEFNEDMITGHMMAQLEAEVKESTDILCLEQKIEDLENELDRAINKIRSDIDWSQAPFWAMWYAKSNLGCYWYNIMPEYHANLDIDGQSGFLGFRDYECISAPDFNQPTNSITRRPE